MKRKKAIGQLASAADVPDPLHDRIIFWGRARLVAQTERMAWAHRLRKLTEKGIESEAERPDFTKTMADTQAAFEAFESVCDRHLVAMMKTHPLAKWIKAQRGVGLSSVGQLLSVTGNLNHFATVSKLWAYLGQHTVGGRAPRRRAGEQSNWHPRGRVICHLIGEAIVKSGGDGVWRAHYDRKRAEYLARERSGPSGCPFGHAHHDKAGAVIACVRTDADGKVTSAHVHAAAMRYAVKMLLKAMWLEWRRQRGGHSGFETQDTNAAAPADTERRTA